MLDGRILTVLPHPAGLTHFTGEIGVLMQKMQILPSHVYNTLLEQEQLF
jgi:hypothetical protein